AGRQPRALPRWRTRGRDERWAARVLGRGRPRRTRAVARGADSECGYLRRCPSEAPVGAIHSPDTEAADIHRAGTNWILKCWRSRKMRRLCCEYGVCIDIAALNGIHQTPPRQYDGWTS